MIAASLALTWGYCLVRSRVRLNLVFICLGSDWWPPRWRFGRTFILFYFLNALVFESDYFDKPTAESMYSCISLGNTIFQFNFDHILP